MMTSKDFEKKSEYNYVCKVFEPVIVAHGMASAAMYELIVLAMII